MKTTTTLWGIEDGEILNLDYGTINQLKTKPKNK